jgi:hypothetical protein
LIKILGISDFSSTLCPLIREIKASTFYHAKSKQKSHIRFFLMAGISLGGSIDIDSFEFDIELVAPIELLEGIIMSSFCRFELGSPPFSC